MVSNEDIYGGRRGASTQPPCRACGRIAQSTRTVSYLLTHSGYGLAISELSSLLLDYILVVFSLLWMRRLLTNFSPGVSAELRKSSSASHWTLSRPARRPHPVSTDIRLAYEVDLTSCLSLRGHVCEYATHMDHGRVPEGRIERSYGHPCADREEGRVLRTIQGYA